MSIPVLLLVISAGWFYSDYVQSVLWHLHGDYTELGGRRVRLPILWRSRREHGYAGHSLKRACPGLCLLSGEITASPISPRSVRSTDEEEIQAVQGVANRLNAVPTKDGHVQMIQLPTRGSHLICVKDVEAPGESGLSELFCYAAKIPVQFGFIGRPAQEQEAETILSSMQ